MSVRESLPPWQWAARIVDPQTGVADPIFLRWLQSLRGNESATISDLALKADKTTLVIAGAGLTGGGDLSADRTFNVGAGTGITVNANDVALTHTAGLLDYDTDGTLTANSDAKIATQKATKTYVDAAVLASGSGTVTSVSVVSANGFAGTVATATLTPAITLTTSITGVLKGNGTAISAAAAATDYVAPSAYASANGLTMATARLLGRTTASTGAAEEITVSTGLQLAAGVLSTTVTIQSVVSAATVTPTFSNDQVNITAQAAGLTLANPTGTAVDGWGLSIRIKDNGTARAISYGTQYRAIGVTLPTTTVISKTLYLGLIFNNADTRWDVVAVAQEA